MKIMQLCLKFDGDLQRLPDIAAYLAGSGINIIHLTYIEGKGIKIIANDQESAVQVIKERGLTCGIEEVLVVEIPDKPGGLAYVLQAVNSLKLIFSDIHAFSHSSGDNALVVINFKETDLAAQKLSKAGLKVLSTEELLAL